MAGTRPSHEVAALVERAGAHWRSRRSRLTPVRQVICEVAFTPREPLDAEQILVRARRVDRLISLATVYRTIGDLQSAGLLQEVVGSSGQRVFAVLDSPSVGLSHVICRDCKKVIPLENPCLPLREAGAARQMGFNPRSMTLRVEADCEEFHRCGHCSKQDGHPQERV